MSVHPDLDRAGPHRATGSSSGVSTLSSVGGSRIRPSSPSRPSVPRSGSRILTFARRQSVVLACVATLLVHLLWLSRELGSDEGGFAMVAHYWLDGGPFLYGQQWVDRPPGLIGLFAAAGHLGPYGVRLAATVVAVGLVAALAWAADAVGGRPAARWAAWAGFAFASSSLLEAQQLNGELAAAMFVTVSVAALLRAVRVSTSRTHTAMLGMLAGASATLAVLMKQNFVDAFVFATVLLTLGGMTRTHRLTYRPATVLATVLGFAVGTAIPAAATFAWATAHGGPGAMAYAMFGFRTDAASVMANWSWAAPLHRLQFLWQVTLVSGLLFLLLHLAFVHRRRLRRLDPLPWAVAATAGVELLGVFAGENFWPHYLIALIPMVALGAGLSAHNRVPGWRWTRRLIVAAAVTTALVSTIAAFHAAQHPTQAYTTGRWVAAAAQPNDTIVVPYTHANVIDASGLKPGYPYAWSLPLRTLDPQLSLLTSTLNGQTAPTWVIQWDNPHTWGLDPDNHVDGALRAHYRPVAVVCGHQVWLHDGLSRHLAPMPPASACGAGAR